MKELRIMVRCLAQPKQHAKVVRVKARLGRRRAEELAELLDGTSLAYVHPPGPQSPIGRCCVCGGEVEATVTAVVDGNEIPPTEEEAIERDARKAVTAERKLKRELEASKVKLLCGAGEANG